MRRTVATMTFALLALMSLPAAAAERTEPAAKEAAPQLILPRVEARVPTALPRPVPPALPSWAYDPPQQKRPLILPALYLSLGVLQGMDVYTTTRNLKAGASELNPLMEPVAGNVFALTAVKVASTATSIYIAERLWKKNRFAAIAAMVASNVIVTAVVAKNFGPVPGR